MGKAAAQAQQPFAFGQAFHDQVGDMRVRVAVVFRLTGIGQHGLDPHPERGGRRRGIVLRAGESQQRQGQDEIPELHVVHLHLVKQPDYFHSRMAWSKTGIASVLETAINGPSPGPHLKNRTVRSSFAKR